MEYETKILICTHDGQAIVDLFCKPSARPGDWIVTEDKVKVIYDRISTKKAIGYPEIVEFTLTFGLGVAAGVIASWIHDKLKREKPVVTIVIVFGGERYEKDISASNREEITKIIEEITKFIEEKVMGKDGYVKPTTHS